MYIFISHSSNDAEIAQELCSVLESNGSQCFLAPRDIRSGFEYAAEIINGIDRADAMLLLLSNTANNSPHILREIERAVSKSIPNHSIQIGRGYSHKINGIFPDVTSMVKFRKRYAQTAA